MKPKFAEPTKIFNNKKYKAIFFGTQNQADLQMYRIKKEGGYEIEWTYGTVFVPSYNGMTKKEKLIEVKRWVVYIRKVKQK